MDYSVCYYTNSSLHCTCLRWFLWRWHIYCYTYLHYRIGARSVSVRLFGFLAFYSNTDISPNSVRGILGTVLMLAFNFGILCAFILGNFFSYDMVAWIISSLSVVFLLCFSFLKETPQHLLNNNKIKVSYPWLRHI